ncbi:hypothetical protein GOP47_0021394 [Adiantum capillus-veneris]|uniref:Uncharacterized protein n=1 Tax=Adiantum capillus-veneris TaxID=13818 RepID=A0A9D4U895_ADICA|nr:hypothetical protein GOP47_0021394 [Adiantum capillus-veneris]
MLSIGSQYQHVLGLPNFFWEPRHREVFVPLRCEVGIDTCLLVYLAQRKVPEFEEKGGFMTKLLEEPLIFVISQTVYVELMEVLLMESKIVPGVIERSPLIKPRWVALCLKKMTKFGKRVLQKVHLEELNNYVEKLRKIDGYLSKADARFNRSL